MAHLEPEQALPLRMAEDGHARRVGIELEFGGLPETRAAGILKSVAGGTSKSATDGVWQVEETAFGRCEAYLDTRFRDDVERAFGKRAVDLARLVVPVELVTDPFDPSRLPLFDPLVSALRREGAVGSRRGLLLGFGVHLNIEIAAPTVAHLWKTVTAYALIEAELRRTAGVDVSRRILPFVRPFPDALVDDLAWREPGDVPTLIETYLKHAPTRNHGLDMLPVFAHLAPNLVEGRLTDGTETKPRPAYHFRMPDCRIDERDWSIFAPWSSWLAVERLAASPDLFDLMREERLRWSRDAAGRRERWSDQVRRILDEPRTALVP